MLDKLGPKKIVIVSSSPQIRFPDCYGIDMSKMKEFVAFRAVLELLKESGREFHLEEVYEQCKGAIQTLSGNMENHVKNLYTQFSYDEISRKVSEIVTPKNCNAEIQVVFQTIDNLHKACPKHIGDWYFTGDYATPGGNRVANKAYMFFMEGKTVRAY